MSRVMLVLALVGASALVACGLGIGNQCGGSTSNGASPCGTDTCSAGTFCSNPAGSVCENGCKTDDNCATGQKCDLSNAQTDLGGNKVGQCATQSLSAQSDACDGGASSEGDAGDAGTSKPTDAGSDAS